MEEGQGASDMVEVGVAGHPDERRQSWYYPLVMSSYDISYVIYLPTMF